MTIGAAVTIKEATTTTTKAKKQGDEDTTRGEIMSAIWSMNNPVVVPAHTC